MWYAGLGSSACVVSRFARTATTLDAAPRGTHRRRPRHQDLPHA